ncbi:MAG: hypothetical protein ACR2H4_18750 [Pyrinomonadaceae bacterium]
MKRHWENAFFTALENTGSVTAACEAAKISRVTVYAHKRDDPAFAERWEQALDAGADTLEDEARRRAINGTSKGSDTLLIFLLKGLRPQRWRESRATLAPAELNKMIETELARIAKQKEVEAQEPLN